MEITDSPDVWRANGFEVDEDGCCIVSGIEHRLIGPQAALDTPASGVIAWGVSDLGGASPPAIGDVMTIDGIATTVEARQDQRPPTPDHANGVFRIDHLVIRTSNTPKTVAALEALGGQRRGGRDTNSAGEAVDMTFFWAEDTLLELAGPREPKSDTKPARLAGIAYACNDLDATVALLGERSTTPVDAVQPGRRISALTPSAGSSVPTAFMTPHRS